MENWGLITYGKTVSAVNLETTPAFGKEWIASFYSHEIAHQVSSIDIYFTAKH